MKDGTLKIELAEGQVIGVSVGAGLDKTYERIFESSLEEAIKPSAPLEFAIKVVVFGCFWIEAVCNERLKELMDCVVRPEPVGRAMWQSIERRNVQEKLELLASFSTLAQRDEDVSTLKLEGHL